MGNREFCTGCGASDFHTRMSCEEAYPERWAAKEKERKAKQAIIDKENARVAKLVKATLSIGGKKAVVARMLLIQVQKDLLNKKKQAIEAKITALNNENKVLRDHCPHPKKYFQDGFAYSSCNLCGELF